MIRSLIASIFFLGALGLFGLFGFIGWRALTEMPARNEIATASADAPAVAERARQRAREREAAIEAARADPAGTTERQDGVRYLNKSGIISLPPEGPLTRTESPVVVEAEPERAPDPTRYRLVIIESAGLINARTHMIELAHVDAPAADDKCTTADGREWPCGMRARTALRRLVQRRAVDCLDLDAGAETAADAPAAADGPSIANCTVAGVDLSRWLVEQGWARPAADAPDAFASLADEARSAGRGLYDPQGR
ncbi:hypothetical protein L1787_01785 [Acuticoccus sp. M5D2P5]|uniref:thermonuclease family protein n=1 Tax=Acuticoccus kalidii TaxID=2910977 RepID=UPI001F21400D|nr:hypothetical protein [Acuticoccus kalidii]MCF3932144.1 hypothetical protein [Acuticoccus kalidii]